MSRLLFVIRLTLAAVFFVCVPGMSANAAESNRQLGVASCAGSTCHGATQAFADRGIRQDEYFVWQREDAHARAHETLKTPRARSIAQALGLGSAEQAGACLACHAPAPAMAARGPKFSVNDGIGCETCHGAAESWIDRHAQLNSAEEKVSRGMRPTWSLDHQAALCSGCHVGDRSHPITHRMMAAGHPPLLFELDTFIALLPPHWDVDADYRARKPVPDPARRWAEGQLAAADAWLSRLEHLDVVHGSFPELALFDCDACHHAMPEQRMREARAPGLAPGAVPLADHSLVLLQAWASVMQPRLSAALAASRGRLYASYAAQPAALRREAKQLRALLREQLAGQLGTPNARELRLILGAIVAAGEAAQGGNFLYAQQTAMAAQVLGAAWNDRGGAPAKLRPAISAVYDAVQRRDRFSVPNYQQALTRLKQVVD